jgi:hypothetical protein
MDRSHIKLCLAIVAFFLLFVLWWGLSLITIDHLFKTVNESTSLSSQEKGDLKSKQQGYVMLFTFLGFFGSLFLTVIGIHKFIDLVLKLKEQ